MANSDKNIEQVFKNGFNDFEHEVSSKVWNNIDAALFQGGEVLKSSNELSFKNFVLATIPILFMLGSAYFFQLNESNNALNHSKETTITVDEEKFVSVNNGEKIANEAMEYENKSEDEFEDNQIIIVENKDGDEVEETLTNSVQESNNNEEFKENNNDDNGNTHKNQPSLPDKPYLNESYFEKRGAVSYSNFCISKLREGILLVRLKTRSKSIGALEQTGRKKKAEKLKSEVFEDNKAVVEAFLKRYNFSNVYFFYSSESEKIRERNFEHVFVNPKTLQIDETIQLDPSKSFYMILDIGTLKVPSEDEEYVPTAISRALVVKSRDFEQMYRPFPFYIMAPDKSAIKNQVSKLNERLHIYYEDNRGQY